ncbi:hypothetical protein RF11_00621 [Thelohanellus kitauei]|uniref:Uncharacterized protein n=1 Tax=Thelohanellus kitauei TaxID=669202 RepID=A0A0C2JYX9_THEKT|nr:hypothetical protein RF11_00621 [Thelohanellus kitauei]
MVDHFSHWVEAKRMYDQTESTVEAVISVLYRDLKSLKLFIQTKIQSLEYSLKDSSSDINGVTSGKSEKSALCPSFDGPIYVYETLHSDYKIDGLNNPGVKLEVHYNLLFKIWAIQGNRNRTIAIWKSKDQIERTKKECHSR